MHLDGEDIFARLELGNFNEVGEKDAAVSAGVSCNRVSGITNRSQFHVTSE